MGLPHRSAATANQRTHEGDRLITELAGDEWRVWNRHDVETRAFLRATRDLPEMECAKQLVELLGDVWFPGISILDVGCSTGHYLHAIKRLGGDFSYVGVDATSRFIEFAEGVFTQERNAKFVVGDVFDLRSCLDGEFDVVVCCNLLLHLPRVDIPLRNLIQTSRKYVFIRTLMSDMTHMSRLVYDDAFDDNGNPTDFKFQNTWSRDLVASTARDAGADSVEFISDRYDVDQIGKEHAEFAGTAIGVTRVHDGLQIAGSKVFEWEWVKITR